jgi:hypothetical protein
MVDNRIYATKRQSIVSAIVDKLKNINGTGAFQSNLNQNVFSFLKFYSDITDFPAVCVVPGSETRDYQAGGYKDRYLNIRIMIFINEENALDKCEAVIEDIETVLEDNARLAYKDRQGNTHHTIDITINSIGTDEGTLEPYSVGEIGIVVHY